MELKTQIFNLSLSKKEKIERYNLYSRKMDLNKRSIATFEVNTADFQAFEIKCMELGYTWDEVARSILESFNRGILEVDKVVINKDVNRKL